ncbi:MAG TPA: NUDIX domain-containing protein [Jatrophihabitans sp.]
MAALMQSGDGWTTCAAGHRHWGRFGAAGLLITDSERVVLQHRAPWTHEGDTFGLPGGARHSDEDAVSAALREANEEAALDADDIEPLGLYVDDHDGWSYTTVVACPRRPISPVAANAESVSVAWHHQDEVTQLPLHRGFAAAWQQLRIPVRPLYIVATGEAAEDPLLEVLGTEGVRATQLPTGMSAGKLSRLFPRVIKARPDAVAEAVLRHADCGQVVLVTDARDLQLLS